ncbi:MAG: EamA family transporter [Cyanobacteria bacterium P01_D01_bin.44]
MTWLLFASGTALFEALKDVTGKQTLKTLDEYAVLFGFMSVGVLVLLPVILLTDGFPVLGPNFGGALLVGGSLNILAFIFYVRAIKIADLSLTVPLVTLTPLFLLATSPLIVQEWPTWADGVGVILLVMGSYVLNLRTKDQSFWTPLLTLVRHQGSRLMLCVAFIWSITANFDKIGTLNSSPMFWAMSLFAVIAAGMVPFMIQRGPAGLYALKAEAKLLGLTGCLNVVAICLQFMALPLAPVAQVVAVKRTSTLIAVVLGHFVFGEKGLRERLLGAAIMVTGVAIMALF